MSQLLNIVIICSRITEYAWLELDIAFTYYDILLVSSVSLNPFTYVLLRFITLHNYFRN